VIKVNKLAFKSQYGLKASLIFKKASNGQQNKLTCLSFLESFFGCSKFVIRGKTLACLTLNHF
jgi:hypothetical protein